MVCLVPACLRLFFGKGSGQSVTSERLLTWSRQPVKASRRRLTRSLPAADGCWSLALCSVSSKVWTKGCENEWCFCSFTLLCSSLAEQQQRRLRQWKSCLILRAGKEKICDITQAAGLSITRQVEQYRTIKKSPYFKIVLSAFRDWKIVFFSSFFSFLSWCVPPVPRCPSQSLHYMSHAPGPALAGPWL